MIKAKNKNLDLNELRCFDADFIYFKDKNKKKFFRNFFYFLEKFLVFRFEFFKN